MSGTNQVVGVRYNSKQDIEQEWGCTEPKVERDQGGLVGSWNSDSLSGPSRVLSRKQVFP